MIGWYSRKFRVVRTQLPGAERPSRQSALWLLGEGRNVERLWTVLWHYQYHPWTNRYVNRWRHWSKFVPITSLLLFIVKIQCILKFLTVSLSVCVTLVMSCKIFYLNGLNMDIYLYMRECNKANLKSMASFEIRNKQQLINRIECERTFTNLQYFYVDSSSAISSICNLKYLILRSPSHSVN